MLSPIYISTVNCYHNFPCYQRTLVVAVCFCFPKFLETRMVGTTYFPNHSLSLNKCSHQNGDMISLHWNSNLFSLSSAWGCKPMDDLLNICYDILFHGDMLITANCTAHLLAPLYNHLDVFHPGGTILVSCKPVPIEFILMKVSGRFHPIACSWNLLNFSKTFLIRLLVEVYSFVPVRLAYKPSVPTTDAVYSIACPCDGSQPRLSPFSDYGSAFGTKIPIPYFRHCKELAALQVIWMS